MTSSKDSFVSLGFSSTSKIEVEDSSFLYVEGKGDIYLDGGSIQDALYCKLRTTYIGKNNLYDIYSGFGEWY